MLVVVRILVAAFDKFLLSLLETERSHKPVAVVRDVDVGHVAGVVNARFALQVMPALVDEVCASLPMVIDSLMLVQRLLAMALIYWILPPVAVQVLLTWDRLERFFREVGSIRHRQCVLRAISVQGFCRPVHLLQLWHIDVGVVDALLPTDLCLLVRALFIISDGDLSHKRVTVACRNGSTRRLIDRLARYALPCRLCSRSVRTASLGSTFRRRRLRYLH